MLFLIMFVEFELLKRFFSFYFVIKMRLTRFPVKKLMIFTDALQFWVYVGTTNLFGKRLANIYF